MLYLKNESDAKDALQDLFLKLWEKKPKFKNKDHAKAWIIRAAKHRCLDVLKSSWHKKRNVYEPDRQQVADETEKEDSLLDQIQKLPQKYREVLYLYYYEEYSVKEISNLMVRQQQLVLIFRNTIITTHNRTTMRYLFSTRILDYSSCLYKLIMLILQFSVRIL